MYDDIINKIAYSVILDDTFLNGVFKYAEYFGVPFFVMLGIVIGIRFLKNAFDL